MLTRRVPMVLVLIAVAIGVVAGKAWALIDEQADHVHPETPVLTVVQQSDPTLEDQSLVAAQAAADAEATARAAEAAAAEAQRQWDGLVALAFDIGACEEPVRIGNTVIDLEWNADGHTADGHFAGAFGMRTDLYATITGGRYATRDTPAQQIVAFGKAWATYGPGAWACRQAGRTAPAGWREARGLLSPP
jgi:hypothetical protein